MVAGLDGHLGDLREQPRRSTILDSTRGDSGGVTNDIDLWMPIERQVPTDKDSTTSTRQGRQRRRERAVDGDAGNPDHHLSTKLAAIGEPHTPSGHLADLGTEDEIYLA